MGEHNALGYRSGLALCLTKVRSSRARCPATALIKCLQSKTWIRCTVSSNNLIRFFAFALVQLFLKVFSGI